MFHSIFRNLYPLRFAANDDAALGWMEFVNPKYINQNLNAVFRTEISKFTYGLESDFDFDFWFACTIEGR